MNNDIKILQKTKQNKNKNKNNNIKTQMYILYYLI